MLQQIRRTGVNRCSSFYIASRARAHFEDPKFQPLIQDSGTANPARTKVLTPAAPFLLHVRSLANALASAALGRLLFR